jgi:hypothetical protein
MRIKKNIMKIPTIKRFKWERRNMVSVTPPDSFREREELELYNMTVPTTQRTIMSTNST